MPLVKGSYQKSLENKSDLMKKDGRTRLEVIQIFIAEIAMCFMSRFCLQAPSIVHMLSEQMLVCQPHFNEVIAWRHRDLENTG